MHEKRHVCASSTATTDVPWIDQSFRSPRLSVWCKEEIYSSSCKSAKAVCSSHNWSHLVQAYGCIWCLGPQCTNEKWLNFTLSQYDSVWFVWGVLKRRGWCLPLLCTKGLFPALRGSPSCSVRKEETTRRCAEPSSYFSVITKDKHWFVTNLRLFN